MSLSPPGTPPRAPTADRLKDRARRGRRSRHGTPPTGVVTRLKLIYGGGSPSRTTIVRRFGLVGPLVSLAGVIVALILKHSATGVSLFWAGTAGFFFTNYAAARRAQPWIIGPAVSACATLGCLMLVLVSVIAGIAP